MAAITITSFASETHHLRAKEPLKFDALFDESSDLYFLRDNPLGVQATASSMEALDDAIRAELDVMWRVYALEEDDKLTPAAQRLKRDLLEVFGDEA